jgi:hypothetical protein
MGKSAFEYHPAKGGGIRLGKLSEPKEIILAKYHAAVALHSNLRDRLLN